MNWQGVPLYSILQMTSTAVSLAENVFYKQAAVQPYPRGVVLKAVKRGFDFPRKRQKSIRAGQFMIARMRAHRRVWGIVPPELDGALVNQGYLIFDVLPAVDLDYFAAYLSTPFFSHAAFAARSAHGRLQIQPFLSSTIPLPSLDEQRRVADLWKQTAVALDHTAEMASSITDIKSGLARELFRNGNSSWEQRSLGEVAQIGHGWTGSHILSIRLPNTIALGATVFNDDGIRIAPNAELDSLFLYYYLESQKHVLGTAYSSAASDMETVLRTFPLPLPTLYEQRKITILLEQHDEALSSLRSEQNALRHLMQGLIHNLFDGTLDLQAVSPLVRKSNP